MLTQLLNDFFLLESLCILVLSILIRLKAIPRREFLNIIFEYISLRQIFAVSICSEISSVYARILLWFGRVASPRFNPICRILSSSLVSILLDKLITTGFVFA